jgi:ethanolamine ammonia-lyase small subunit
MAISDNSLQPGDWPEIVRQIRARTPARIFTDRSGAAYRTTVQLDLRECHAAARDAVRAELNLEQQFTPDFVKQWGLFEVATQAETKEEYLQHPNLGRIFRDSSQAELLARCPREADLQIAIGDGLSVSAVVRQVPHLLPALAEGAKARGWARGQTFVTRHCRVGILNHIGQLLAPTVAVLLIGERPGLATADSLSAYMAYRPQPGHTDADRNLVSNIHARGMGPAEAAAHILDLAAGMMKAECSGTRLFTER